MNTPEFEDQRIELTNFRLWRALYAAGGIIGGCLFIIGLLVTRPSKPGFVVAIDTQGHFLATGQPVMSTDVLGNSLTRLAIETYFRYAFAIEYNRDTNDYYQSTVEGWSTAQTQKVLKTYYHEPKAGNDPFMSNLKYHQTVQIKDVLKMKPKDEYQVRFDLIRTPYAGEDGVTRTPMVATVNFQLGEASNGNPGFTFSDLDFSKEAQ